MNTQTQFLAFLKVKSIDYKKYDYVKGKTTEKYMKTHPTVIEFRRYYENPLFWKLILEEKKLEKAVEYFIENYSQYADKVIINSIIPSITKENKNLIYNKVIIEQLKKSEDKELDADSYLMTVLTEEKYDLFDEILDIIKKLEIKPVFGSFGNISNCKGLLEMAKNGNELMVKKLINLGANPNIDDSMSFLTCLRYGFYKIGLMLKETGADIHIRNNFGLKIIQINDQKKIQLSEENKKAREELLKLYNQ